MDAEELAGALTELADWARRHAPRPDPPGRRRVGEHFGAAPTELPVVAESLRSWDRPNLQVALDVWLADREVEVLGLPQMEGYRAGLVELVRGGDWSSGVELGGVEHVTVALGEHERVVCVKSG